MAWPDEYLQIRMDRWSLKCSYAFTVVSLSDLRKCFVTRLGIWCLERAGEGLHNRLGNVETVRDCEILLSRSRSFVEAIGVHIN